MIRYPWKRWLSRRGRITLIRGVDYHCQPHSMGQQCRNAATKLGVSLSVHIDGDTVTVLRRKEALSCRQ